MGSRLSTGTQTPPRLLVLGVSSLRASAFTTWQRLGLDVVLVDGHALERYELLVDEFHSMDVRDRRGDPSPDLDRICEVAKNCQGVVTLADNSQVTAAAVAEQFGLPGVGIEAAKTARSKLRQRELCQVAGLRVPQWRRARSPDDIREFYRSFYPQGAGPAVLKPTDSAGSAGVLQIESAEHGCRMWSTTRMLSPSRSVLVEEFVGGREIVVDAVVESGNPVFVSVCDAEIAHSGTFIAVAAKYDADHPCRAQATEAVRDLVRAMNVVSAIVHAEYKVHLIDDRTTWTLLETAFRPGGALVPDLTEYVTGGNLYRAQAQLALGLPLKLEADKTRRRARFAEIRFLVAKGQVRRSVSPAMAMEGLADVRIVHQMASIGRQVRAPVSDEGRAACALGWSEDSERLDRQLQVALIRTASQMGVSVVAGTGNVCA